MTNGEMFDLIMHEVIPDNTQHSRRLSVYSIYYTQRVLFSYVYIYFFFFAERLSVICGVRKSIFLCGLYYHQKLNVFIGMILIPILLQNLQMSALLLKKHNPRPSNVHVSAGKKY